MASRAVFHQFTGSKWIRIRHAGGHLLYFPSTSSQRKLKILCLAARPADISWDSVMASSSAAQNCGWACWAFFFFTVKKPETNRRRRRRLKRWQRQKWTLSFSDVRGGGEAGRLAHHGAAAFLQIKGDRRRNTQQRSQRSSMAARSSSSQNRCRSNWAW